MLYENYYKKVSIIARILNQIRRFRAWFIGFAIGVLIALFAFILMQGTVYGERLASDDVFYGDEVVFNAKALFQDVSYEFSNDQDFKPLGEGETPKLPGEYYIRAVSKSFFGTPKYGKAYKFNIVPRPIDVKTADSFITYGNLPNVTAELVYEDRITCESYSYEDISAKATKITPKAEAIRILDTQGVDVTYAYALNPVETDIHFTPRDITITVEDASDIYDALPFSHGGFGVTQGNMAVWGVEGSDQVIATFDTSLTNVGMRDDNVPTTMRVLHPDGKEVTHHYNISVVSGTLTVLLRPVLINILTDDPVIEHTYDAEPHSFTLYEIDKTTPLVPGHKEKLISYSKITNVGQETNLLAFEFYDEAGNNVTDNHYCLFAPENVILKVTPRPISINVLTDETVIEHTYDDTEISCKEYEIDPETPLVEGHKEKLVDYTKIKNVGEKLNVLEFKFFNGETDVSSNYTYTVNPEDIILKVNPRPVKIQMEEPGVTEWVYDAQYHSFTKYKIIDEDPTDDETPLVVGHSEKLVDYAKIKNVGEVTNYLVFQFIDGSGNDITRNYEYSVIPDDMVFTVTPKYITLELNTESRTYDGTAIKPTVTVRDTETGEEIELPGNDTYNKEELETVDEPRIDVGVTVTTIDKESVAMFDSVTGEDVKANYEITTVSGELTITPLDIVVMTPTDLLIVYDGRAQTREDCFIEDADGNPHYQGRDALSAHKAVPTADSPAPEVKNVADTQSSNVINEFEVNIFDTVNNRDVSHNYNILRYEYGELKVIPRPIKIVVEDKTKVYDDTPLVSTDWSLSELDGNMPLSDLHEISAIEFEGSVTNVNTEPVYSKVVQGTVVITEKGTDIPVTENYDISYQYGMLTVTPRHITFRALSDSKVYDDMPFEFDAYEIIPATVDSGLLPIHRASGVRVEAKDYLINVGETSNDVVRESIDIVLADDPTVSVLSNYDIELISGTLTITKLPIRIDVYGGEWIYDALPHFNKAWTYALDTEYMIIDGHVWEVSKWSEVTNVADGIVNNVLELEIRDSYGFDVTPNYDVTIVNSETLSILKRDIYIETFGTSFLYDGKAHSYTDFGTGWNYTREDALYRVVDGQLVEAIIAQCSSITNYTEDGVYNDIVLRMMAGDVDVSDNYNVIVENKEKLFINKRDIYIVTLDGEWTYDGKTHYNKDYEEGGWKYVYDDLLMQVVDGQSVVAITSQCSSITNVWESGKANVLRFMIMSGDEDLTYNYNIHVEDAGILTVTQRAISVVTESMTWIYDGEWHDHKVYSIAPADGIVSGQVRKVVSYTKIQDVVRNEFNEVIGIDNEIKIEIFDGDLNVTDNYDINYDECGLLTVTPRDLTVKTDYHMWKFEEGQTYSDSGYNIVTKFDEGYGLIDRHKNGHRVNTITEISELGQKYNELSIIITEGDKDVTGNYEIEYIYGILFVVEDIRVTTESDIKVYDGTELTNPNFDTSELPYGCRFEGITVIGKQKNVGFSKNNVIEENVKVFYGDEEVECIVEFTYGKLEVTVRKIVIATEGETWVYDGEVHTLPEWDDVDIDGAGLEWHLIADKQRGEIVMSTVPSILNVLYDAGGNVIGIENRFTVLIFDENGEDVTGNYFIDYACGELKVTPRPVTITTEYKEKVYDDKIPEWYEFTIITNKEDDSTEEIGLLNKHTVTEWAIDQSLLGKNVNLYTVRIVDGSIVIIDNETGEVMTGNYDITFEDGYLNVTPRPVTIHTNYHMWTDEEVIADENGYKYDIGYTVVPGDSLDYGFISGHGVVVLDGWATIDAIGEVRNKFAIAIFNDDGEVTSNYAITYEYGMLFVTDEIKITTASDEKIYDGTPLTKLDGYSTSELNYGCSFRDIYVIGTLTNAGEKENAVNTEKVWVAYYDPEYRKTYKVLCNIDYDLGLLTVTAREITILTHSNKWLYDGAPHSEKNYTILDGTLADGQVIEVIKSTEIVAPTTSGPVDNIFEVIRIRHGSEYVYETDVNEANYNITWEYGQLEIVAKKTIIVIKLKDISKEYDGKPLEFNESCFEIQEEDPELEFYFTEFTSITLPGKLTAETIANMKLPFNVIYQGYNVGRQCEIAFEEGGGLTVTEREIKLKASDAIKEYDGSPLKNENVEIFEGELVDGHILYAKAIGENIDQDEVENVVDQDSVRIYYIDPKTGYEVDVTACYKISYMTGKLQIK